VIASNNAGSLPDNQTITVRKADADEPLIEQFDVCAVGTPAGAACPDPLVITLGEQVVIRWRVQNPQQVSLNILGTLEGPDKTAGERTDMPGQSGQITYMLVASDAGGASKTRTRRANVAVPPTAVPLPTDVPPPTAAPPPITGNGGGGGAAAQTMTVSAANAAAGMAATGTASAATGQTATASANATMPPLGSWRLSAAPLSVARTGHAATLLKDGKILVTGSVGSNPTATALNTAEIFDPTTNTWKPTASMSTGRTAHTATLLDNGTVLVVGGYNNGDPKRDPVDALNTAELYDPAKNTWSTVGSLPANRAFHTATLLKDGGVLVVGGASSSGGVGNNTALKTADLYNPVTKTWLPAGTMSVARIGHTATRLGDGTVLVTGGLSGAGSTAAPVAGAEIFNAAPKPTWTVTGALGTARTDHAAVLLQDGTVLVTGGRAGPGVTGTPLNTTELYSTATKTWSKGPTLSVARAAHTATLLNSGAVLVAGGKAAGSPGASLNSAELLPLAAKAWQSAGTMTVIRSGHTATLRNDGQILVVGGTNDPRTEGYREQ